MLKHMYKITRHDSGAAPDKEITVEEKEVHDTVNLFTEECANRVVDSGAQKAIVTIERIVVDE